MERQKFEEKFRTAFEKAEVDPSERVWTNIELDLERLEGGDMKRRLLFFKLLAAASIVFALAIGGGGIYILTTDSSSQYQMAKSQDDPAQSDATAGEAAALPDAGRHSEPVLPEGAASEQFNSTLRPEDEPKEVGDADLAAVRGSHNAASAIDGDGPVNRTAGDDLAKGPEPAEHTRDLAASNVPTGDQQIADEGLVFRSRPLPVLVRQRPFRLYFPKTEPDQIDLLLASIELEEKRASQEKRFDGEKIWTSLGFSAGTFDNFNRSSAVSSLQATSYSSLTVANTLTNETNASGISYSVGLSVGGKIGDRWVLQGGLNYLTQNSAFTSDAVVTADYQNFKAATSAEITKMADASARVVPTAPYDVNNSLQFLSFPLQAGYLLVNRSFGLQLNGGFSTDLFLQNTLTPQSGSLDKVTSGRGSDSPYRPVNFSGLLGTEISYRFGERYRVTLNPGIRYPFRSIYKSDIGLSATPVTFDVGLRFRYIFE